MTTPFANKDVQRTRKHNDDDEQLDFLSLPGDAIRHVLGFVHVPLSPPNQDNDDKEAAMMQQTTDLERFVAGHNDLYTLYTAWPAMRPHLPPQAFGCVAQQQQQSPNNSGASLHDDASSSSSSLAQQHHYYRLKILSDADVRSYQCSGETAQQGVRNLLLRCNNDKTWCGWYDPTLRLDAHPYHAQFWLRKPVQLVAYGLTSSSGQCPDCDPVAWRLLGTGQSPTEMGYYRPYTKFGAPLHQVDHHCFAVSRHEKETAWWYLPSGAAATSVVTIRLAIDATRADRNVGTQLSRLYLVVIDE